MNSDSESLYAQKIPVAAEDVHARQAGGLEAVTKHNYSTQVYPAPWYTSKAPPSDFGVGTGVTAHEAFQQTETVRRNPFGWSPLTFGFVVGLVTAVVVGVVVGGAVGGALGSRRSQSSLVSTSASAATTSTTSISTSTSTTATSTPTALLTNYIPSPPSSIQSLHNPCNDADGSSYVTAQNQTFRYSCYDIYSGADRASVFVYTLNECIDACSALNYYTGHNDTCVYVAWSWNLYGSLGSTGTNCWMKGGNATLGSTTGDPNTVSAALVH